MNAGKDVHTLMREIALPPEKEVGEGYGKVSWSVRAIWESYAGWFHHRSTSELYSVPASSMADDIVELAGGADRLVERARARHAAGEHEQALHLLDTVRDAGADTAASFELGIAVHEALLEQSENFWLSAWLKHQIKQLRAALDES